jgi:PadR family transcriptional regulator PadR
MTPSKTDLLQGTLDMLLMRAVTDEALHGYALVHRLKLISGGRLNVPQGSLYPALHRLENQGFLKATWGETDTGREAKFYKLTAKGRSSPSPSPSSSGRNTKPYSPTPYALLPTP